MTEEANTILALELDAKVRQRIRQEVTLIAQGVDIPPPTMNPHSNAFDIQSLLAQSLVSHLCNNPYFITEITKRIGQKMQNTY